MESQSDMQIGVVYHGRRLLQSTNSTANTTTPYTWHCDEIIYEYDICTAIICGISFVLGVIYTFFGYRCFKVLAFFTGLVFGSLLVYLICLDVGVTSLPPAGVLGIAFGAGLICGIITLLVKYISLFMTGLHLGFGIGLFVIMFMDALIYNSEHFGIPLGIVGGLGILFAFLALKYQKGLAIVGTSMIGSVLMVGAIDYYIEKFIMVEVFWSILRAEDPLKDMCWFSWAIFACWPFCILIGAFIQWRVTGHNVDHSSVVHGNRIRKLDLIKLRAALYQDTQGLRYRDLYKARRIKGDQILQNYSLDIKDKSLTLTCKSEGTGPDSANTTMTQLP